MKITIRNFRGAERADLDVSRIALLAGDNGAGKSSIIGAIAAALTGQVIPLAGVKKGTANLLVRAGAKAASVSVEAGGGRVAIAYPKAEATSEGDPPRASSFAAGLASVAALDDKERSRVLADYLKTAPTAEDLASALHDVGLGEKTAAAVWQEIEKCGWDDAYARARETGSRLKGQWQQVTGRSYGSQVAATWAPEGYTDDLDGVTLEELRVAADDARRAVDEAIAAQAVDQAVIERLEAEAADVDAKVEAVANASQAAQSARERAQRAQAAREALPPATVDDGLPCPHCGGSVRMRQVPGGWKIEAATSVPEKELKQRRQAIAAADGELFAARAALVAAEQALRDAEAAAVAAQKAEGKIAEARSKSGSAEALESARAELRRAEARLAAAQKKAEASALAAKIAGNQKIIDALAPDGVRRTKLLRALEAFNSSRLAPLCEVATWRPVTVTEDLQLAYGGRPYVLLSASEQYRVRVVMQIAMAQLDGSAAILLDGADILSADGRNGLLGLLSDVDIPAIVGMTISAREDAPDLARHGLGVTYWIEDGIAAPLGQDAKEAA